MGANNFKALYKLSLSENTLFSGFAIKILQQVLILLIPFNAHVTISFNRM
jgi:hypothetical protein